MEILKKILINVRLLLSYIVIIYCTLFFNSKAKGIIFNYLCKIELEGAKLCLEAKLLDTIFFARSN